MVWLNRRVTSDKKPLFYEDWYKKGIFYVGDLVDDRNKFLSFEDLCNEFIIGKDEFLKYYRLRKLVNKNWTKSLQNTIGNDPECIMEFGSPFYVQGEKIYNLEYV